MPRFIFALHIVTIKLPTLKHQLIIDFAFEPDCISQILIQMMAISDFGETLMTLGLEARTISLKI